MSSKRRRPNRCKYCGNTPRRGQGICRKCEARPKAENIRLKAIRDERNHAREWIYRFVLQRNISQGNIATLTSFLTIEDSSIRQLTELVLEIARVKPHRRRRFGFLQTHHPALFQRMLEMPDLEWLMDSAFAEGQLRHPDEDEELPWDDSDMELESDEDDFAPRQS